MKRTWEYSNNTTGSLRGLGDVVAIVAQPIAKTIDKIFHTNIKECNGCKKRQEILNNIISFI